MTDERELEHGDKLLLRRAYEKVASANEIMRFLADHFRDKYGLTPENQITPDGRIITVRPTQLPLDGAETVPHEIRQAPY
jgi:hypothetical protein